MQNYRLTIIAQFEKQHETLRNTALSREWEKLVELFESLPPTDRASVLATLADFIFAEGYLILRFPDESAENKRDRFREWLETSAKKLLGQVGFEHIVKGIEYSRVVECLYRDAYNECCKRAGDYDALSLIWAGIRLGHNEYVHWYQKAKGASKNGAASDRISKPLPSGTDGLESTFTDIVFKIDTVLQRELRFIGEQNGWFNDELQIPNHRKATAIQVAENRRNALAVFDKIEDSDTRTRLFAGVWRTQITGPSEGNKKITALLHPVDWQVALCVAGERLQRRIAQLLEKLTAKQTVNEDHVNSMASVVASAESPGNTRCIAARILSSV